MRPQQSLPVGEVTQKEKQRAPASTIASGIKHPRMPESKEYDDIKAVIITWQDHDHDGNDFEEEICKVVKMFEEGFGVWKCEKITIPTYFTHGDAASYVQDMYSEFDANTSDGAILNLVYYGGHGGLAVDDDGNEFLNAYPRADQGHWQSFEWNTLLQNTVFAGANDTVVFMDCCLANLAMEDEFSGCKYVFGASAGDAARPGERSFTSSFVDAAFDLDNGCTMVDWATGTLAMAREKGSMPPVLQSFGDPQYQIHFMWEDWVQKCEDRVNKEFEHDAQVRFSSRCAALSDMLEKIRFLGAVTDEEFPIPAEIQRLSFDQGLVEPFTQVDVFRAFRRMKDVQLEHKLDKASGGDNYYDVNKSSGAEPGNCGGNNSSSPVTEDYGYHNDGD